MLGDPLILIASKDFICCNETSGYGNILSHLAFRKISLQASQ